MSTELLCYRCGASLAAIDAADCPVRMNARPVRSACTCAVCANTLIPWSRNNVLKTTRKKYSRNKRANFCEWYKPGIAVFNPKEAAAETRAQSELAVLFGEEEFVTPDDDELLEGAEDLFEK